MAKAVVMQGKMMHRALAGTKVLPQDQADNPLSRKPQIKADLSSQDLFCAVPNSGLDPVAVLFLSVLRSVRMGDEALVLSHCEI